MKEFSGCGTGRIIVITDLDILMDFHQKVWGVPVGPTMAMTKPTYKMPISVVNLG